MRIKYIFLNKKSSREGFYRSPDITRFAWGDAEYPVRSSVQHIRVLYDDVFEDDPGKHLLIGFDSNANLLEIMYNVIDERHLKVFHAMKCRDKFLPLLNA